MRFFFGAVMVAAALIPASRLRAAVGDAMISEPAAERHGLTRPWWAQVEMDRSRARVTDMALYEGALYVQTNRANVTALDAETGRQLWSRNIGRPDFPSLPLGVGGDLLATVNGSQLYVCNRYNGEVLYETRVAGSPCGSPALSDHFAFVPTDAGSILAYRLEPMVEPGVELGASKPKDLSEEEKAAAETARREGLRFRQDHTRPVVCQSNGRAVVPPLVTKQGRDEDVVAWPTEHGVLSRARIDHGDQGAMIPTYELKTDAAITSRLAYLPPNPKVRGDLGLLFATSTGGYVYAVTELRGNLAWKFPTSEPVLQPPAVIEDRVYVPTQLGGMFCCEAKSGRQLWWAPQVLQFVAASKQRVYAADRTGRTEVLDAMTGARLNVLSTEPLPLKLLNVQTDRLYLATDTGLVQCLHEIEQTRPILHGEDRKVKREEEAAKPLPSVKKPKSEPAEGEPKPKPKAATKAKPADKSAKKTPAKAINGAKKKQAEDSN